MATRATRAVAYLRVSTDKQADRGVSLEVQRTKIEQYAQLYNIELVAVEEDAGASAKTLERPALQRALATLKSGAANALLIFKLDRLTRRIIDLGSLLEKYFGDERRALLSVSEQIDTSSAAGRLVLNMLMTVAQWERETIGERTKSAMQHLAEQGKYVGGKVPYGYAIAADGKTLVPNELEQKVIALARELHAKHPNLTLRAIAAELARRGHRSRSGKAFEPSAIAAMLRKGRG